MDTHVTLTDEEREALRVAINPAVKWGDHGRTVVARMHDDEGADFMMETLAPAVEHIIAAREADVLRRVAEKWDAQKEAGLMLDEPWSRGYWNGIQTAIDALRDEAVYIERISRPTTEGDPR